MKKFFALMCAACLSVAAVLCITGCGGSSSQDPKEAVRAAVSEEFDQIVDMNGAVVDAIMEGMDSEDGTDALEELGIDPEEFIKVLFANFSYEIKNIDVDGNKASVTLTMTSRDMGLLEDYIDEGVDEVISDMLTNSAKYENMTEDELMKSFGNTIMTKIAELPMRTTDPFTITYTKSGNTWSSSEDDGELVADMLLN